MLTLDQFKERYGGLKAREVISRIETDPDFRSTIETIYQKAFHKKLVHTCSNCWFDAYVLIMKTNTQTLINMQKCLFELRAGVVLVNDYDRSKPEYITNRNLTNELALSHLAHHPEAARKFSAIPENWASLLPKPTATKPAPAPAEPAKAPEAPAHKQPDENDNQGKDDNAPKGDAPDVNAEGADKGPEQPANPEDDKEVSPELEAAEKALKIATSSLKGANSRLEAAKQSGDEKKIAAAELRLKTSTETLQRAQENYDKLKAGAAE